MNRTTIAKDLIKKGKELEDDELIKMGYDILNKTSTPEVKVDFTSSDEPVGDVVLDKPLPKNILPSIIDQYKCENCNHTFDKDKLRKRCPKCHKHKLILISNTIPEPVLQKDTTTIFDKNSKQQQTVTDDNGIIHVYAKSIPIDVTQTKYNRFADDNTLGHDAENEFLKTKTPSIKNTRPPATTNNTKICEKCNQQFTSILNQDYMCSKCIRRR